MTTDKHYFIEENGDNKFACGLKDHSGRAAWSIHKGSREACKAVQSGGQTGCRAGTKHQGWRTRSVEIGTMELLRGQLIQEFWMTLQLLDDVGCPLQVSLSSRQALRDEGKPASLGW